eukprot:TRINITY_DN4319_c0_g1_i4.p1 TRINITY_DN4319_c0_g1~~TRINITY_DN4319_c0_g1_i4.p1  ORF type:complete len:180 (+),score=65.21 TRINITY_DN4319_c0_g1_i4:155-694(+)
MCIRDRVGALLVATKLLAGDQDVGGLQAKWLASMYVCVCVVLMLAISSYSAFLGVLGVWFGWVYLRFWQKHTDSTGDGLSNVDFSFASFFPEPLQPVAQVAATLIFNLAALCRLVKKRTPDPAEHAHKFYSNEGSSLGTNPAIAERRRQQAQQELETRLAQVGNEDVESLESLLDNPRP